MDPRRIDLNRRHSREMRLLFGDFLRADTDVDVEFAVGIAWPFELTDDQDAAWGDYSAELLARHQAERAALAAELEAERGGG